MQAHRAGVRDVRRFLRSFAVGPCYGGRRLGKQARYGVADLVLQVKIEDAAGATGESRVDPSYQAIAADKECCRPRVQVFRLWDLLIQLARFAGNQVNVINLVTLNEGAEA
jgi:hypothetical protein